MNMKKIICSLIVCLLATFVNAQVPCDKGKQAGLAMQFRTDIENNTLKIYTVGGLKPYNYELTQAFQKKFSITYHDFGCLAPMNMDYYQKYNQLVFQYLKNKWGTEWEKDIKDNAIGFNRWLQLK